MFYLISETRWFKQLLLLIYAYVYLNYIYICIRRLEAVVIILLMDRKVSGIRALNQYNPNSSWLA